jgi:hypothetical protein
MDIHKPKPWHGLREFAKELGTIILGILIALALEAGVEALRERRQAAEARANIRQELAENLGKMRLRLDGEACHIRRLHEVQDLLALAAQGKPLPQPILIGEPDVWVMYTSRLDVAAQGGRATLLAQDEQAAFARIYAQMRLFAETSVREQSAWATLRTLENGPLDPAMRPALTLALQEARFDRFRNALAANQALREAADLGVRPNTAAFRARAHFQTCLPLNTPREDIDRHNRALHLEDLEVRGPSA